MHEKLQEVLDFHGIDVNNVEKFAGLDGRYHTSYVQINKVTDQFYIGQHSTYDLDDGYFASGVCILKDYEIYGKLGFSKLILKFFSTKKEALELEKLLTVDHFLINDYCYNISKGGTGGYQYHGEDTVWIYNPNTLESKRHYEDDELPEGFIKGKLNNIGNNFSTGMIYISNPKTGKLTKIPPDAEIPEGWVKGNPTVVGNDYNLGRISISNPITGEHLRIYPDDEIPEGFVIGRNYSPATGRMWVHNPVTGKRKRVFPDKIPEGFVKGQARSR